MAGRKENLKALFTNVRTRVIVVFTAILLITAVVIGVYKLKFTNQPVTNESRVALSPGAIESIPGTLNPTAQYAKLQEMQNVSQASTALKSGGSAIPTIVRTQALGEGVQPIGVSTTGQSGVGFSTLTLEQEGGVQHDSWVQALRDSSCSKSSVAQVVSEGAALSVVKEACSCMQLKDNGYALAKLEQICSCKELRAAGFNARQLKDAGFTADRLRLCGFDACELRNAGFTAQQMKDGGFSDGELKGAGFTDAEIAKTGGLPQGISADAVRSAGCQVAALQKLHVQGVTAAAIRRISGCSPGQLRAAGFSAEDLKNAGFSAADLKKAGFTPQELSKAGIPVPPSVIAKGGVRDCSVASLKAAHAAGVSALTIKQTLGCSAAAMKVAGYSAKELRDAGFTVAELKNAGFGAADLKTAGFSAKELKEAGLSAADLRALGFNAADLKAAGYSPTALKAAGFSPKDLKEAGFSAADLHQAGYSAKDLALAGFGPDDLKNAGYSNAEISATTSRVADLAAANEPGQVPSNVTPIPSAPGIAQPVNAAAAAQAANAAQLQTILKRQNQQLMDQRYQQKIQQRTGEMLGAANQSLQTWQRVATQVYTGGNEGEKEAPPGTITAAGGTERGQQVSGAGEGGGQIQGAALIKTGDILFGVIDTSINSDEPGPILATIVSGRLKGAKLIGSFNLPANADKMVISFNTMSIPGAPKTIGISAYAIDPNTARTALSSQTNHHYLLRYGSLFASSFLEGFGNAFQSADTTVTIGGTGGGQNITVQNGIHRSTLKNAVIAMSTLGKAWGQAAQQQFSTPTTVEVYSGTGVGILFTQDVASP